MNIEEKFASLREKHSECVDKLNNLKQLFETTKNEGIYLEGQLKMLEEMQKDEIAK